MSTATTKPSYDDFEPYCKWQREDGEDFLEVHVPGFKKDDLKIQLSSHGIMTITGVRNLAENRHSRFQKEIDLSKEYKTNEVRARLAGSVLRIRLPKMKTQESQPARPLQNQENAGTGSKPKSIGELLLRGKLGGILNKKKAVTYVSVAVAVLIVLGAFFMHKQFGDLR